MRRGDVRFVDFEPVRGAEANKTRPAVIVSNDGANSTAAKYEKDKVVEQLGVEGSIAVQVHGGKNWPAGAKCRWKNIRIKPLG